MRGTKMLSAGRKNSFVQYPRIPLCTQPCRLRSAPKSGCRLQKIPLCSTSKIPLCSTRKFLCVLVVLAGASLAPHQLCHPATSCVRAAPSVRACACPARYTDQQRKLWFAYRGYALAAALCLGRMVRARPGGASKRVDARRFARGQRKRGAAALATEQARRGGIRRQRNPLPDTMAESSSPRARTAGMHLRGPHPTIHEQLACIKSRRPGGRAREPFTLMALTRCT